jgi:hypothetical protein
MRLGYLASKIGMGLFAGLAGTAAMTLSSTIEMKLRQRPPSMTPAEAAGKVLGVRPESEAKKERFSNMVHWSYGTAWGGVRGLLEASGYHGRAASVLHFLAVWGVALNLLPGLKVTPPVKEWETEELAIDGFHHLIYVIATAAAYKYLKRG